MRAATSEDEDALAEVLASAFFDDPIWSWIVPDEGTRQRRLSGLFRAVVGASLARGDTVLTTDVRAGAAVWREPGRWQDSSLGGWRRFVLAARSLGLGGIVRLAVVAAAIHDKHPRDPHWYLELLGTDPPSQGTGVGSALIREVTRRCDAGGLPAYLETQRRENVEFYGRHGFEVVDEVDVSFGGPHLWLMWRKSP